MFNNTKQLNYGKVSSKLSHMTVILGARFLDEVVLVADKKITKANEIGSISFEYKRKLHGNQDM
jgi:20S proteasome alpha/beta subunit